MIPKIIWQTHEKKYEDLENYQKNIIDNWKNLNPGWKHRYVGSEERSAMVKEYSNFLYDYYLTLNKIDQSDIWRLVAMYVHGGFYADMDSLCVESIDSCLNRGYKEQEFVCSPIGYQHTGINNSNFGAIKNSYFIKSVLDNSMGCPVNTIFSKIAQDNKDKAFFCNEYFSHSNDYKKKFASQIEVIYNNKKIKYRDLAKIKKWIRH